MPVSAQVILVLALIFLVLSAVGAVACFMAPIRSRYAGWVTPLLYTCLGSLAVAVLTPLVSWLIQLMG